METQSKTKSSIDELKKVKKLVDKIKQVGRELQSMAEITNTHCTALDSNSNHGITGQMMNVSEIQRKLSKKIIRKTEAINNILFAFENENM